MMKFFVSGLVAVIASTGVFALSELSSLSQAKKEMIQEVITALHLPNTDKNKQIIYKYFKPFIEDKSWNARWTTSHTPANSKIKNATTQICDVVLFNDNRIVNNTFIYFSTKKQLFVSTKEYIASESDKVLQLFKKYNANEKYTKEAETDNYAYFTKKGYMDYTAFHVTVPVGMIMYESDILIDIK